MKCIFLALFISICFSVSSQNSIKNGPFKKYFDNGQLKRSGQYKNKKKVGSWKEFYETGELKSTYSYTNGEGKTFFKNGIVKTERVFINGKKIFKKYFETGELLFEREVGGGYAKVYFKNGNLKSFGNYSDSELTGKWKGFYNTGELEWEVEYFKSCRQGTYRQYYKTGQLKIEGENKKDEKHGLEKRYYPNGTLHWKGKYENGVLHGKWKGFDSEGNQIHFQKFENGLTLTETNVELLPANVPDGLIENVPVFPGCEKVLGFKNQKKCTSKMINIHVSKKFNTDIAAKLGLEGQHRMNIIFKIDKQGGVVGARARAPHPLLKKEAIRVIKQLPKMKPGHQIGKPVVVPYSLPIIFQVPEKKKQ